MNRDAGFERTEQTLTQNQLSELLETDQAKALVEGAEERGYVEPTELEAFALELDLNDVLVGIDAATAHFSLSLDAPASGSDAPEPQLLGDQLGRTDGGFDLIDAKLALEVEIARLPHRERTALQLRLQYDLKQSEIAQRMGCSQMQVSRLLRQAAAHVRELTDPALDLQPR